MIEVDIPGFRQLRLAHVVLDFNGTLACDGMLLPGMRARLEQLARAVTVHVITGDTFGTAREQLDELPCHVMILVSTAQDLAKRRIVKELGVEQVAAIGNGRNDCLMLEAAALGIAVLGREGTASATLLSADLVVRSASAAFDVLLHPRRLIASLRR